MATLTPSDVVNDADLKSCDVCVPWIDEETSETFFEWGVFLVDEEGEVLYLCERHAKKPIESWIRHH